MSESTAVTTTPSNDGGNANADANPVTPGASTQAPADGAPATTTEETKSPESQVPETYDLKMPEGIELDQAAAEEFSAIAKELKLDNATAQRFADIAAKQAQRQAEAHAKLVESWAEQVRTDKDIGGDKLPENLATAKKALDTFGSPELRDVLNSTGFGNHPAIIKAFYQVGKAISEDRFVTGKPPGAPTDPAQKLFPSMN